MRWSMYTTFWDQISLNKFPFFASRFLVYVMYVVLLNLPINSEIKCANGSILVGQLTNEEKPYRE